MEILLTFDSVHCALKAEAMAPSALEDITARAPELLPLPASVKSDCGFGLCLELEESGLGAALKRLMAAGLRYEAAYRATGKGRTYERIN
jgi:hypothetical protein